MSSRHFDATENAELRTKIDAAKARLPVPELMRRLSYEEKHIGESAYCPFHSDKHKSFSVFHSNNGKGWQWKCFAGCGYGDEIAFLVKHFNISRREAIRQYLEMAGFPSRSAHASREYPKCPDSPNSHESPEFPESHVYPVFPVSNGQALNGKLEKALRALGADKACKARNTERKALWKLTRDLKALEKGLRRELEVPEIMPAFDEWHRRSQRFLDAAKTRDDYLAELVAGLPKVRVPIGEGDTIRKALEAVSKLPASELPVIPGMPGTPESWRRLAALHHELSRFCRGKAYFLSYRDAAKVCDGLTHQKAYNISLALDRLGVIKILRKGKAGLNSGKAAEFQYLLSQSENGAEKDDAGFDL